MAIFSRKSKADKAAAKQEKKEPAEARPKTAPKPASSHVRSPSAGPRNAASQGGRSASQPRQYFSESPVLPVPQPPFTSGSRGPRNDYFSQSGAMTPSYHRDHSYQTLQYADSGYDSGSAMHSRAPSEKNFPEESKYYSQHSITPHLPELGLNEGSFGNEENVSPVDAEAEMRSLKSNKSSTSAYKRARFEHEPMPALGLLQSHQSGETRRSTLPPLSILDGLKVNKKGRILDEEGDPIGELVEGDLLDCVRQKANARGEVLDEYGRVVGVVRTIAASVSSQAPALGLTPAIDRRSQVPERSQSTRQEPSRPALSLVTRAASTSTSPKIFAQTQPQSQPQLQQLPSVQPEEQTQVNAPADSETPAFNLPTVQETTTPLLNLPEPESEPEQTQQKEEATVETEPQAAKQQEAPAAAVPVLEVPVIAAEPATKDFASSSPELAKRVPRNSSERSLSELGKTYVRPTMNSVPEDNVAEDIIMPVEGNLFAFRGEIPVDDRPQREARSRSPNVAINPKAALALGQPNSALLSQNPRMSMNSRRATTQYAGGYGATASSRSSIIRPSPLSSHGKQCRKASYFTSANPVLESSPGRSESGADAFEEAKMMHSRTASFISNAASVPSAATSAPVKPRTYFTHGGKITVDANAQPLAKTDLTAPKAAPAEEKKVVEKKKSRFSFGKKTAAK